MYKSDNELCASRTSKNANLKNTLYPKTSNYICNRWCRWRCATFIIFILTGTLILMSIIASVPTSRPRLAAHSFFPNGYRIDLGKKDVAIPCVKIYGFSSNCDTLSLLLCLFEITRNLYWR